MTPADESTVGAESDRGTLIPTSFAISAIGCWSEAGSAPAKAALSSSANDNAAATSAVRTTRARRRPPITRGGATQVTRAFVRELGPIVFAFLSGMLGDQREAEEGMQETFVRAARAIERYTPGTAR